MPLDVLVEKNSPRHRLHQIPSLTGNARPRLSSSLCELPVLRGAHCDWIASLLNATGAIPHEYLHGSSLHQVFADQTVLGRHQAYVRSGD